MGVFRVARFLCACLVGLLSLSVLTAQASWQKPVVRPASATDVFKKGGQTFDINRHWGEIIDVPAGRVNVPVVERSGYGPARIAASIKQILKNNPLKVAGTAAGVYLIHQLPGANFDPLTGEPVFTPDLVTTGYSWAPLITNATVQPTERYSTERAACIRVVGAESSGNSWTMGVVYHSATQRACTRIWNPAVCPGCGTQTIGTATRTTLNCPYGVDESTSTCRTTAIVPVPFTDAQFDQLVSNAPLLTESHWSEIGPTLIEEFPASFDGPDETSFTGPDSIDLPSSTTTSTNPVTGDVTVTESLPSIQLEYGTAPLSITPTPTTTSNTYTNGNLTNTTTTTTNTSSNSTVVETPPEIPTDCDFMPTVCAFIDWVKSPFEEEEPDLTQLISDEDYTKAFNVNSNASCPAPATIETAFGSFQLSYEPACMWAGMIKPFVLIAALISAIFISLGAIRGSD